MCNPMMLLMGAGAVVSGIAGASAKKTEAANYRAEAESYDIQRQAAERDAANQREAGAYEGARAMERGRQLTAKQVAGYSSRGISPSTGTPLNVITSTGADIGLDVAAARHGTRIAIENANVKAKVAQRNVDTSLMNARDADRAAPLAFISPILNTGATFLRGGFG